MAHMSLENREIIEEALKEKKNFTQISDLTGYHRTTISSEIIKHRIPGEKRTYGNHRVNCKHEQDCSNFSGPVCMQKCECFEAIECIITTSPPYVCNGCTKKQTCRFQRFYYRAKEAQKMYEYDLKNTRSGLLIPPTTIQQINEVIAPLIKEKHQTVNQVYINHPDILYFSKSEFYHLVNEGYVDIKNIDLPRQVKYRKRKSDQKMKKTRMESVVRQNRTYSDYQKFLLKNPNVNIVQVDTVEGIKGGKVFLTINFIQYELMLIYLLEHQTSEEVSKRIRWIQDIMGLELYSIAFACVLTDNGHEFFEPEAFELIEEQKVVHLFYCDPSSPYQKGCCEVNHHYIRYYLPKGNCSFDDLTQEDCNLLMSHINSIPREKNDNQTPYDAIQDLIPENILNQLGVVKVEKDDVNLSPSLLNGKGKRNDEK